MKIVAWFVCWLFYWSGHLWSSLLNFKIMGWTYPVYSMLMRISVYINDKYSLDVWSQPK